MHRNETGIRRRADGTIDTGHYARRGAVLRDEARRKALVRLADGLRAAWRATTGGRSRPRTRARDPR